LDYARWFGGDPDQLWHTLTIRRLLAGKKHIQQYPPADILVAAKMGYKAPVIAGDDTSADADATPQLPRDEA